MKRCKKKLFLLLLIVCSMFVFESVEATTITASANSVEKGKSVTITVSVPNVNTVDLTATVSGAGTSGTIRLVDGSMTGEAKTFSKSITVTPTSAGTITVSVSSSSNAVLNGAYVDVSASKTITVTEPVVVPQPQPSTGTTNSTTPTTPSNNVTTQKPANTTTQSAKSSNANLKNMILNVEGMSPSFSKDITTYSINVGENVNDIKVTATVAHSRASYSVTGNTNLKEGENKVTVKVTAEDGTVKTYTINVLKADDPVKSDATLYSLIIEDVDLGQVFDSNVTEYSAGDITVKADKLNIYAYTNNENAKVEILGNENLNVGEGKITIRVTSENGKITKDYVVSFNKLYSEESIEADSNALKETSNKVSFGDKIKAFYNNTLKPNMTVIILYVFIWVEFIQVAYLYERLKKYEELDKITISRKLKNLYVRDLNKDEKEKKTRRVKENPIFPDEENKQ